MSILRITSTDLNKLCESLQKISLFEDDLKQSDITVDDNNKFSVDIKTNTDEEKETVANNIEDDQEIDEIENTNDVKQELTAEFIDAIKNSIDVNETLQDILQKFADLKDNKEVISNTWKVNDENNNIHLASKRANIFKQNNKICLSHDGYVELFDSYEELEKSLKDNNYATLDKNTLLNLQESTDDEVINLLQESEDEVENVDETVEETDEIVDECFGGVGVTSASFAPAVIHTVYAKPTKKKNKKK